MPQYRMLVLSHPVAGRETEYNDWYQNVHLKQVMTFPGFLSARRFRLSNNLMETPAHPYAAIYEIETDDIDALLHRVQTAAESGELTMSEAIDTESAFASIYEACGPTVSRLKP